MDWLQTNWVNVLATVGALDGLFYAVTKLTKSDKDDNIYAIIHGFVVRFLPKGK